VAGRKPRKSKVSSAPATDLTPDEQAIQDKYPDRVIKGGSLLKPGDHPDYPAKKSVILICPCGNEHRRATQDVFQVKVCPTCKAIKPAKKTASTEAQS
jgi:hypothetical protein